LFAGAEGVGMVRSKDPLHVREQSGEQVPGPSHSEVGWRDRVGRSLGDIGRQVGVSCMPSGEPAEPGQLASLTACS
jgi:hypothetical protein